MSYPGHPKYVPTLPITAWFVDGLLGNDMNIGSSLSPLKTIEGLLSRVAPTGIWRPVGSVVVTLRQGSSYVLPPLRYYTDLGDVLWTSEQPAPVYDTFGAVVVRDFATNTKPDAQTTLAHGLILGDIITLPDDPAGTDVHANVAVVISPTHLGLTTPYDSVTETAGADPTPGDRYAKTPLVDVTVFDQVSPSGAVGMRYLNISEGGLGILEGVSLAACKVLGVSARAAPDVDNEWWGNSILQITIDGGIILSGCAIQVLIVYGRAEIYDCYLADALVAIHALVVIHGSVALSGGCIASIDPLAVVLSANSDASRVSIDVGGIYGSGGSLLRCISDVKIFLKAGASMFAATTADFIYQTVPAFGNLFFPLVPAAGGAVPAAAVINNIAQFEALPFNVDNVALHRTQQISIRRG